jgi:putative transposase
LLQHRIDRFRWIQELGKAKRRYNLCILNYIATSNHIHLLAFDPSGTCIPQAMQWVAGRTAEQYNLRRKRTGAFWSDRYHATAIDRQDYLWRCMRYINLNMVRPALSSIHCNGSPLAMQKFYPQKTVRLVILAGSARVNGYGISQ